MFRSLRAFDRSRRGIGSDQSLSKEEAMASGVVALFVDPPAGSGPNKIGQRVIPFPPTQNAGLIKFVDGFFSLAYDDFGIGPNPISVHVRVFSVDPTPHFRIDQNMNIPVGRAVVTQILKGDYFASVQTNESLPVGGALTALIEYSTP
jgi:hypothetical protein